jgi:hypothetical protein
MMHGQPNIKYKTLFVKLYLQKWQRCESLRLWVANLTYTVFYLSDEFIIKTTLKKTMKTTTTTTTTLRLLVMID